MAGAGARRLFAQLAADCALLEELRVMDYSLLLGVHSRSAEGYTSTELVTDRVRPLPHRVVVPSEVVRAREHFAHAHEGLLVCPGLRARLCCLRATQTYGPIHIRSFLVAGLGTASCVKHCILS